ncbi:MAG: tetratricopeptide repeat protein, partial [SAR324 cluster bacterium]|nr:tetratricopeptide repeat protein [SAR324 cluster bacterium]
LGLNAQWHEAHGRPEEALEGYLRLRSLWERVGDREGVIGVLDSLGGLYFQLGQQEQSTRCYEERLLLQAEAPHR